MAEAGGFPVTYTGVRALKGVGEYTAAAMAICHRVNVEQAAIAGLLHDCAKNYPTEEKLAKCEKYRLSISDYERQNPELLHAKLGAAVAKDKYKIKDREILSAITWHTTGCPNMSDLDKIIYIADYIEPARNKAPRLTDPEGGIYRFGYLSDTHSDQCVGLSGSGKPRNRPDFKRNLSILCRRK